MSIIIKTTSLSKEFISGESHVTAVENINLEIASGTSIAITGPSGCGKTTLINMIGLVIPSSEGEIILESYSSKTFNEIKKAHYRNKYFGFIVQDFALIDNYNIFENIEIPLFYAHPRIGKRERIIKVNEILLNHYRLKPVGSVLLLKQPKVVRCQSYRTSFFLAYPDF